MSRIVTMPKRQTELPSPGEPMAVARRLVASHYRSGQRLRLHRWRGGWWQWQTTHWSEIDEASVRAQMYALTEHATWVDHSKTPPKEQAWAPNRYRINDLLEALGAVCHLRDDVQQPAWLISAAGLPAATELVAVKNGLLRVPTRRLRPHDPALFNAVSVPFAYTPDAGQPERWLGFLNSLWPDDAESIAALQEFFGYVLSGRTDLHKILLLVGPTRAGKGVIARVLEALVGRGHCAGPTLASLGTNFGLQPLIGKPLAIVSDARLGGSNVHQVVERLLSISGEDMLTVDRKYREPWTGTLPTRFVIISNELPRFGDASGAIAARFVALTLATSWLGRENTRLTQEILAELPAILNWALDGFARITEQGRFTEPESSRDAVIALQDLVSPVAAYVRDRCDRGAYDTECTAVYEDWKQWAEENGHRACSLQTFGRDLHAVVPGLRVVQPRTADGRVRCYRGIRLYNGEERVPPRAMPAAPMPARDGTRSAALYSQIEREPGEEG